MSRRGDHLATAAKLVDISIGGCYAESMSPWPVGTEVELTLVVGSNEIVVAGIVRTCHAIMGNGIEFTAVTDETRNSVEQLISRLATTPSLPDQPGYGRALSLEAKVEAILQLLERKKVMTRDEVLTELKKLDPRKLANSWSNSDTK